MNTLSVDMMFLSNALSAILQMQDKLPENEFILVKNFYVDEEDPDLLVVDYDILERKTN